jgi:N-acetylglutamate synthase-like GNAT family acetyltransferase
MVHIREARQADAVEINSLSQDLGYVMVSHDVAEKRLAEILESGADKIWVGEEDGHILGWIHCFLTRRVASPAFVEIGGLVVSPDARRKGLGRQLVAHAAHWTQTYRMKVRVRCNAKRTDTHQFYQAVGFSLSKSQYVFEAYIEDK